MQGHIDEVEYLKNSDTSDENVEDLAEETKEQLLKMLKDRLFLVFFRLNTLKLSVAKHYYMLFIALETFHLLSLVLIDGSYSKVGPYGTTSPWNLGQTQWLIDICWVFRVDRYLRTSFQNFIILVCIWCGLVGLTILLGIFLGWYQRTTSLTNAACRIMKVCVTLITNTLFIPICDTFAFGIGCSFKGGTECLDITEGYIYMVAFIAAMSVFLGVALLSSLFYYDLCMICGGPLAKPHPRFKLLRIISYTAIIFTYYFVDISGKIIVFLIVALLAGVLMCYVYTQYIPYYNITMCKIKLATVMIFTSAVFCMLIGEFFKSTDQTNSSVTMLFYFLTPCLVQIMQLAMTKRGKALVERKFQQITNIYQVEIKGRMLVLELEVARSKSVKSMYGEVEEDSDQEFHETQLRIKTEIESLYAEAFRKFPNSEYLYLWSGLLQLHISKNFILAMVQCFKGIMLANKLDSQYALSHFRRTSESFYKANMKDDAYDYVLFEKCNTSAMKNDESVTKAQFYFWAELESKAPKIQKLSKLASEISKLVNVTKSNYQRLLKLNSKSFTALRMYGGFLASLNNYSDQGQRYVAKAEMQEEAQGKATNVSVSNSLNQPLSFFDSENSILAASGDAETIGEITKANIAACGLFGYLQAELVGRNISIVIPSPFSENHDKYMQHFHESGKYFVIDAPGLVVYFMSKNSLLEARLLVKVLPNETEPPFLMAAIKQTKPNCDIALLTNELVVTAYTSGFGEKFELGNTKNAEQKITSSIPNFEDLRTKMSEEEGAEIERKVETKVMKLICKLSKLTIGENSALVLKVESADGKLQEESYDVRDGTNAFGPGAKAVSTLKSHEGSKPGEDSSTGSTPSMQKKAGSEESESESDNDSEESSSEDDQDSEDKDSSSSSDSSEQDRTEHQDLDTTKKITFAGMATPGMVEEAGLPNAANEGKPLIKRDMKYSDEPDIIVDDDGSASKKSDQSGKKKESSEGSESSDSKSEHSEEDDDEQQSEVTPDVNDAHSAYSSSKSVNSSMASLAQFNKAIKALITYEFSKTKKYVVRFKITLFLTILILIATSITTFKVIEASVTFNEKLSHYVNLVGNLRLYSQSVSYYARMIQLIDAGLLPGGNRDEYFKWMTADTDDMHDINLELYKNYNLLGSKDQSKYIAESISVWLLEGKKVREVKANLFDATSNLVLQAFLLQEELAPPNSTAARQLVTTKNRRVFYLYRNGMGETLDYLNKSARFYVHAALSDLDNQRLISIMLIVVSVILLLFCAGFAIIPTIKTLESSKKEVWEIFFEIPRYVCRIMKGKSSERLQLLNESSNMELEEINPEGDHEDDHAAEEGTKKTDGGKSKDDKKDRKKKPELRRILAYDPRQRKIVILKLFCFFVISLVYFYLIYYTGFEAAGQILKEEPITIDWASRRRQLSRAVNHWVTESLLENVTDHGYKFFVPMGQQIGSPSRKATLVVNELEYVENSLIFGNGDAGLTFSNLRGSTHDTLLFTDACIAPVTRNQTDCTTVADKAMQQGLHSALGMYITLARTLILKISKLQQTGGITPNKVTEFLLSNDMSLLRSLDNYYIYDPLDYSSELYESDYSESQSAMHVWQNLLISLYTIFAVLFYIFVYEPMIRKVRTMQIGQDTKDAWNMCTLIPQEYQEEFKKLNAAIKERRDNFKWR